MNIIELAEFVRESNRIEGILRPPLEAEIEATATFVALPRLTVGALQDLVDVYQPGMKLRRYPGMDVRVGAYFPPKGGTHIEAELIQLLDEVSARRMTPYAAHCWYENLHPFMDGNGRSGRAVWLWHMRGEAPLGFLHSWYYQSLNANDKRVMLGK